MEEVIQEKTPIPIQFVMQNMHKIHYLPCNKWMGMGVFSWIEVGEILPRTPGSSCVLCCNCSCAATSSGMHCKSLVLVLIAFMHYKFFCQVKSALHFIRHSSSHAEKICHANYTSTRLFHVHKSFSWQLLFYHRNVHRPFLKQNGGAVGRRAAC